MYVALASGLSASSLWSSLAHMIQRTGWDLPHRTTHPRTGAVRCWYDSGKPGTVIQSYLSIRWIMQEVSLHLQQVYSCTSRDCLSTRALKYIPQKCNERGLLVVWLKADRRQLSMKCGVNVHPPITISSFSWISNNLACIRCFICSSASQWSS